MSYDGDDYQYTSLDKDKAKDFVITHTTDKWNTAKSILQKIFYLFLIGGAVYVCWSLWQFYFLIGFFATLPFTFFIANKLVKVPLRWYMIINVAAKKLSFFGVPRTWSFRGDSLALQDNKDNGVFVVSRLNLNHTRHRITTETKHSDFDRLEFLNDAKTLDNVVDKLEETQAYAFNLERNFFNEVLATVRELQQSGVAIPIQEIIARRKVDLQNSSVLKRGETQAVQEHED